MGLAESLRGGPPVQPNNTCRIALVRAVVSDEDREALDEAFERVRKFSPEKRAGAQVPYTAVWIQRVLRENGHSVGKESVRRHLAKECACGSF